MSFGRFQAHLFSLNKPFQMPSRLSDSNVTLSTFLHYVQRAFDCLPLAPNPAMAEPRGPSIADTHTLIPHTLVPYLGMSITFLMNIPELEVLARMLLGRKEKILDIYKLSPASLKPVFDQAVSRLHRDGAILNWSGPIRDCIDARSIPWTERFKLWIPEVSLSSAPIDCDPLREEESFISTKPCYMLSIVLFALERYILDRSSSGPLLSRPPRNDGQVLAPTAAELLIYLRNSDDVYMNITEHCVRSTLEALKGQGKIVQTRDEIWIPSELYCHSQV